jgi:hypothetical protein
VHSFLRCLLFLWSLSVVYFVRKKTILSVYQNKEERIVLLLAINATTVQLFCLRIKNIVFYIKFNILSNIL